LSYSEQLAAEGYVVIPDFIEPRVISNVCEFIRDEGVGTRRLIDMPWCAQLAGRIAKDKRIGELLPEGAVAAQCTLFSKTIETNWLVPLHQDLSIPVAERVDSEKCSGWSQKEGELFVQPPVQVLEQVLAVRLHLDDCDEQSGALRVVPGSHLLGRLDAAKGRHERDRRGSVSVNVTRGGAMLMRPLLLHASSKVSVDNPRRVLHFLFGPKTLPECLRWRLT
jgi:ectoine hydroxylase-related dioxygenase (phytanoyl-CoA dioxygenase family)